VKEKKEDMTLLCVPLVGRTVEEMKVDAAAEAAAGGDLVEIRLDFIEGFSPREDLPRLLRSCPLPALVTYRLDLLALSACLPSLHLVVLYSGAYS
jgi:3-dehydroquinate dehydratase